MTKILIVEDEEMLSMILKDTLETRGFEVQLANNGKTGLDLFKSFNPAIVVLDIMLPEMNGYDVAKVIRITNENIPIIFLSAKSQTTDVLKGFEIGANDYLKKPFNIDELIARVNVLLKSSSKEVNTPNNVFYKIGKYAFDFSTQTITFENTKVSISFKESQLLQFLARAINQTVEKEIILKEIWGDNNMYTSKNMDVVITKLRTYFKNDDKIKIINLRGVGYKLVVES